MILPVADGSAGTFDHIIMFSRKENKRFHLTHGRFVVTKMYCYRLETRTLYVSMRPSSTSNLLVPLLKAHLSNQAFNYFRRYYQATIPNDPAVRHIYSITDVEHTTPRAINCLTCNLGDDCLHNEGQFSPDGDYYIVHCLGPGIPRTELRSTVTGELREVLNVFPNLAHRLSQRAMPAQRHLKVTTGEQILVPVKLLLPPGLNEDDTVKYPIIVKL